MAKELINKWKKKFKMTSQNNDEEKDIDQSEETTQDSKKVEKPKKKKKTSAKEELKEVKIELGESKDKYLRLFAEFENYKKRNSRERLDLLKTAAQGTISAILPVLDDFDRAKKSAEDEKNDEQLSEGILMVYNKIYSVLGNKGLQPMESTGEVFDAELHEAITELPVSDEKMKGKIIDTVERGYYLNEKIIRFAKVVVGK